MDKIKKWNKWHAFVLMLSLAGLLLEESLSLLVITASLSFTYFIYVHVEFLKTYRPFGGYAFWLTLFRLIMILVLSWNFSQLSDTAIFLFALIAMLADGLDGWLARRFKTASEFGAYFDMESDALFVCVLACILYLKDYLGCWILGIAYLRYGYVCLLYLLRQDHKKEPANRYASTIAGFLFISILTPFILDAKFYYPIVVLASILVSASFGYSFVKLIQQE